MHPPGVLYSHICGNALTNVRLNSDGEYRVENTLQFIRRFELRGHQLDSLITPFIKATENANAFISKSDGQHNNTEKEVKAEVARRRLYLHIEYVDQN